MNIVVIIILLLFSSLIGEENNSFTDSTIVYSSNFSKYIKGENSDILLLAGDSKLEYGTFILTADTIKFDSRNGMIYASYSKDSIFTDGKLDSVVVVGLPTFTEGDESITGERMSYDVNKRVGKVVKAESIVKSTKEENTLYVDAETIYKHPNNEISGINGFVTGCDHTDHPHYSFKTDSMIMTSDNWVYIKPVYLYIHKVPIGYAPFAFYKKSSGRSSGIIIPSYTYSSSRGHGFKELGFFWDISDQIDYTAFLDYSDFGGFLLTQKMRFRKRYEIDGDMKVSFLNDYQQRNFRVQSYYNQTFTPTTKLKLNVDYTSKSSLVDKLDYSESDRLKNYLTSGGNFNKRWLVTGDQLSVTSSYKQYLDTGLVEYTLPNLSYSASSRSIKEIFGLKRDYVKGLTFNGSVRYNRNGKLDSDKDVGSDFNSLDLSIKESYKFDNFKISGSHLYKMKYNHFVLRDIDEDPNNSNNFYVTNMDSTYDDYGIKNSYSFSYDHKILNHLKLTESFNLSNDYGFTYVDQFGKQIDGVKSRTTYNLSMKASSTIYGIFQPETSYLKKVRHQILPVVTLKYHPDFTKESYGYYARYSDSSGAIKKYDIFGKSVIGGTPGSESFLYQFNFTNIFEGKFYNSLDENSKLFNFKFLKHSLTFNYDMLKDSLNFSNPASNLDIYLYNGKIFYYNPFSNSIEKSRDLKLRVEGYLDHTLSFYDKNNSFLGWNNYLLRKTEENYGYSVSLPYRFKGEINKDMFKTVEKSEGDLIKTEKSRYSDIPVELNSNLSFKQDFGDQGYRRSFNLNGDINISPTENWKIGYRGGFNFNLPKITTRSSLTIFRKIHCFEALFEWDMNNEGYKIEIKATNELFRDLKWEKDTTNKRWH